MPSRISPASLATLLLLTSTAFAQNRCYYGPGAGFRGPSELVPCNSSSTYSSCCLAGDTCLSGNACYNYATGNTYQYGCTDVSYEDESCPSKCGWDPAKSPWMSIFFCSDIQDLTNTWSCLGPESCGCDWNSSYALQILPSRGCDAMGSEARVALYAPSTLLPYVSLNPTAGGSPTYYSTTTDSNGDFSIISTAIVGYTPDSFTQYTTYRDFPRSAVYINPGATASPSTLPDAYIYTDSTPPAQNAAPTSASDISSLSTSSSPSVTSSSAANSSATTTPTPSPASSGLATGAKVGIGVGVAGGVCFVAALGICWFLIARRRKSRATTQQQQHLSQQPPQYVQQTPPQQQMYPYMPGQMPGQQPSGWAPYQPNGMPYYVVPSPMTQQKDMHAVTDPSSGGTPTYSPPHSPPPPAPPMELATDDRHYSHQMEDTSSLQPGTTTTGAGSPRMSGRTPSDGGSARFREGPF